MERESLKLSYVLLSKKIVTSPGSYLPAVAGSKLSKFAMARPRVLVVRFHDPREQDLVDLVVSLLVDCYFKI